MSRQDFYHLIRNTFDLESYPYTLCERTKAVGIKNDFRRRWSGVVASCEECHTTGTESWGARVTAGRGWNCCCWGRHLLQQELVTAILRSQCLFDKREGNRGRERRGGERGREKRYVVVRTRVNSRLIVSSPFPLSTSISVHCFS